MRVPQVVIRGAAGVLAVAVVVTAWRSANPPQAYRAAARIQVVEDAVTDVDSEVTALMRQVSGTAIAVARVEDGSLIDVSLQGADADLAARTVDRAVDEFLRTREAERVRRAEALLAETAAAATRQTDIVQRAERDRAAARAQLARARRDRESAVARLGNVERSLTNARERVAELEPVVVYLRTGGAADSLSVIQNLPFMQQIQARIAELDGQRAALLTRYGPSHPDVERNAVERASADRQLQQELANMSATLAQDYEAARVELQMLEADRQQALQLSRQPLPYGSEYMSLTRRAEAERAALSALELRGQQLTAILREPGSGVVRVARAELVQPMVPSPAPWPWALGVLAALAAAFAAPSLLRSMGRSAARRRPD